MRNSIFRFKEFEVRQDKSAMKVTTDAMLLGAMAEAGEAKKILDVGTGTGVLALMLAQKSSAQIHALDIDKNSFLQAAENFSNSTWAERLSAFHISFSEFITELKYDFIISNPPFYSEEIPLHHKEVYHTKRNMTRQNKNLPLELLIEKSYQLLTIEGSLFFIVPYAEKERVYGAQISFGFHISKEIKIRSYRDEEPVRIIFELTRKNQTKEVVDFVIYKSPRTYSDEYISLTSAYHDRNPNG